MRPFTSTISLDEARRRLDAAVRPIARTERVALDEAAGRVAAADVDVAASTCRRSRDRRWTATPSSPPTPRARRATAPVRLRIVDRIYTGQMPRDAIAPGTCAEIATGAPLPDGADAVVMVEETAQRRRRPRSRSSRRPRRARTSAGAAPTSRRAIVVVAPAIC